MLFLFVPAHDARKVEKAVASAADAVILDLEASVPPDLKDTARAGAAGCLRREPGRPGPGRWVRVHGDLVTARRDISALDLSLADGVVVSHALDVEVLRALETAGVKRLVPMVESAAAFAVLPELARVPGVERFAIGTWDLALDLRLHAVDDPDDSELIWTLRGNLVVASRQLALAPPIDGVFNHLEDDEGLRRACRRARRLGFGGKLMIHPRQIDVVREGFAPSDAEVAWARDVVDAYERAVAGGRGAVRVRGRMIDLPIYDRARALIDGPGSVR